MDPSTSQGVLSALSEIDHDLPIEVLLKEVLRARCSISPDAPEAKAADNAINFVCGYLDGEATTRQCEEEGASLFTHIDDLDPEEDDLSADVECYLKAAARLAIYTHYSSVEQLGVVIEYLLNVAVICEVPPSMSVAQTRLHDRLFWTFKQIEESEARKPKPAPISDIPRNRISGLAD